MAIIGKLMGTRPGMSAPKPAPVSSRPSLDFLTGGQPKQTIPADAFDRDALIQDILSKIQVPTAPVFDPTGLQARLAELESRQAPVFDPSALQEQIAELQSREVPVFDPSELQKQISDLRQRPSRDDFMSIERQLQDLRNREIPQFDASGLQSQIGGLEKLSIYECGFEPFEDARNIFDVKFYIVALLFIIFDLEIAFLFPWAVSLGSIGILGFTSMMIFLFILTIGFIYEWKKGALDWE